MNMISWIIYSQGLTTLALPSTTYTVITRMHHDLISTCAVRTIPKMLTVWFPRPFIHLAMSLVPVPYALVSRHEIVCCFIVPLVLATVLYGNALIRLEK
jgi:hypothetical protein